MKYGERKAMMKAAIFCISSLFLCTVCWAEMVSIKKNKVNVRSGPGKNYKVFWQLYKDCPVKILEKKGEWAKTKDYEGDIGWIHQSLLSKNRTVVVFSEEVIIAGNNVNIRSGPAKNFRLLFQLNRGNPVKVIEREGPWAKIKSQNGKIGWVHKSLLSRGPVDKVNIRTGPGTGFHIGFKAEKGAILRLIKKKGHWLKVKYGDLYVGWIRDDLVWGD